MYMHMYIYIHLDMRTCSERATPRAACFFSHSLVSSCALAICSVSSLMLRVTVLASISNFSCTTHSQKSVPIHTHARTHTHTHTHTRVCVHMSYICTNIRVYTHTHTHTHTHAHIYIKYAHLAHLLPNFTTPRH